MSYDDFLKTFIEENKGKVERNIFFSGYDIPKYDHDKLVDKCCEWASPGLRNSLISDLEYVKHLYKLKKILND